VNKLEVDVDKVNVWAAGILTFVVVFVIAVGTQCNGRFGACFRVGINPMEPERDEPKPVFKCTAWEWTRGRNSQ